MSYEYENVLDLDTNPDIYTLVDEEGVEQMFEMLDVMEHNGNRYFALTPFFENPDEMLEEDADLVILKSEMDGEDEMMISIDDDEEYQEVGHLFLEKLTEYFEGIIFEDE